MSLVETIPPSFSRWQKVQVIVYISPEILTQVTSETRQMVPLPIKTSARLQLALDLAAKCISLAFKLDEP